MDKSHVLVIFFQNLKNMDLGIIYYNKVSNQL